MEMVVTRSTARGIVSAPAHRAQFARHKTCGKMIPMHVRTKHAKRCQGGRR